MSALADDRRAGARDVRPLRRPGRARRAVLRDGAGRRHRRTARPTQLEPLGPERTAAIAGRMVDVLAALHAVDPAAVGLAEFGRPHGLPRAPGAPLGQAARGLEDHASARTPRSCTAGSPRGCPRTTTPGSGSCTATTASTTCSPAPTTRSGRSSTGRWPPSATPAPTSRCCSSTTGSRRSPAAAWSSDVSTAPGYPEPRRSTWRGTPRRSGRDLGDMGFHLGLAYFKLAVILEGIHFRYLQGQTVGEGFDQIGAGFDPLIAAGLDALGTRTDRGHMDFASRRHDQRAARRRCSSLHGRADRAVRAGLPRPARGEPTTAGPGRRRPVLKELQAEARELGLWNLFLPAGARRQPRPDQPRSTPRSPRSPAAPGTSRPPCSTARRPTPATWRCSRCSARPSRRSAGSSRCWPPRSARRSR